MTVVELKAMVRDRDGQKCRDCGMTADEHTQRYGRLLPVHRLVPGSKYALAGCVAVCIPCHGKRHRAGPMQTLRLPDELARKLRVVAAFKGKRPRAYLESILRPIVERELGKIGMQTVNQ